MGSIPADVPKPKLKQKSLQDRFVVVWASRFKDKFIVDYSIRVLGIYERKTWIVDTDSYHRAVLMGCVAANDRLVLAHHLGGLSLGSFFRDHKIYPIFFADTPADMSFQTWKIDRLTCLEQPIGGYLLSHVRKKAKRNRRRIRLMKRKLSKEA